MPLGAPVRWIRLAMVVMSSFVALPVVPGQARPDPRGWVSSVVTKISMADRGETGEGKGTVTIRVRIAADGSLDGVSVDEGSGVKAADERAIRAVRAASPFKPPPKTLLSLEGYTELAFPLEVGARSAR